MANNVRLVPPCAYQGGKNRIASSIVEYILATCEVNDKTIFFDLCSGSGAVSLELVNHKIEPSKITMCDISSWGKFYKSIGNETFSVEKFLEYANSVPEDKNMIQDFLKNLSLSDAEQDEEYKYIILQSGSFGGKQIYREGNKWKNTSFRNYWQPTADSVRRSPVNPMQPSIKEIVKRVTNIYNLCKGIKCENFDIRNILDTIPKDNCIIYIDPPYKDTTKYGFNFDYEEFILSLKNKTKCPIFVSEGRIISEDYVEMYSNSQKSICGKSKRENREYLNRMQ